MIFGADIASCHILILAPNLVVSFGNRSNINRQKILQIIIMGQCDFSLAVYQF